MLLARPLSNGLFPRVFRMHRSSMLAAVLCLAALPALAQIKPAPAAKAKKGAAKAKTNPGADTAQDPAGSAKTGQSGTAAAPSTADVAAGAAAAPAGAAQPAPPAGAAAIKTSPSFDSEEFRRQVMEEVRRELQKTKDEVKQETAWVEQDSQARVQDSEAVEQLKQRVNLFQPHGYLRLRGEFFHNLTLGRGADPAGYSLFPTPFIGADTGNKSQSDANFRFRFEPTFEVSEDLAIYSQLDVLDNILLGSDPVSDNYIDPFTPLAIFSKGRAAEAVHVKRLWGRVNTQIGEILFGRMGYHWGLGILHHDGNCLDCDYGDTYDRVAFAPREFKGHHLTAMFDLLSKGQGTTGEHGELGRTVDLDTLDDGYRIAIEITHLDTPEDAKRKLDANEWVINYGLLADRRTQAWDTPVQGSLDLNADNGVGTLGGSGIARSRVVRRSGQIYQPDVFVSLRKRKFRLDAEVATTFGSIGSHQNREEQNGVSPTLALLQPVTYAQVGAALQSDLALFPADALLLGLEIGGASGDKGSYGFGARPWRSGGPGGNTQPSSSGTPPVPAYRSAGPGDIDGNHIDFFDPNHTHGRVNNFVFNRAFNVDMILFRNLVTALTSAWYLKPSFRYRPTGRKTGGGDDTGFEIMGSVMYSQAWYSENTPGQSKPLGLEANLGITYDTTDRFHTGLAYGLLLPFSGFNNVATGATPGVAHAARLIMAIPF